MINFSPIITRPSLCMTWLFLLTACGGPANQSETADEYAARINRAAAPAGQAAQVAPSGSTAPPGAAPRSGDPDSSVRRPASPCDAGKFSNYLGKIDSAEIRAAIASTAQASAGVRYIRPGEMQTQDFNNTRLNVMFDNTGVIRDFRCG